MAHTLEALQSGLPIFEDDMPLGVVSDEQMTALRQVNMLGNHFSIHNPKPLKTYLEEADTTLEHAANLCNALLPQHTWGLRRVEKDYTPFTPDGYGLFAEVEVVDGAHPVTASDRIGFILERLHEHKYEDKAAPARWPGTPESFVDGYARVSNYVGMILMKIDPVMLLRPKTALRSVE
jgi:hypothetical protein